MKEVKANKTTTFKLVNRSKLPSVILLILALLSIIISYSITLFIRHYDISFLHKNKLNIYEREYITKALLYN